MAPKKRATWHALLASFSYSFSRDRQRKVGKLQDKLPKIERSVWHLHIREAPLHPDHLDDLFDLTGEGLGNVDDHVIECMHQYLNKRMQNSKYFVKDLASELHGEKKLKLLLHVNGYNI